MQANTVELVVHQRNENYDAVWGASYKAIAQALRCLLGTVASRAAALVAQGKITPRQRGGAKARQEGSPAARPPSTVHRGP
jgi:hypothetical protein